MASPAAAPAPPAQAEPGVATPNASSAFRPSPGPNGEAAYVPQANADGSYGLSGPAPPATHTYIPAGRTYAVGVAEPYRAAYVGALSPDAYGVEGYRFAVPSRATAMSAPAVISGYDGRGPVIVTTAPQQVINTYDPYPPYDISQTVIDPPRVSEIRINELLPFQVTPTYTIERWVVRSNVSDRGQLAREMLLVWNPDYADYGRTVDSSALPQVFLFRDAAARAQLQRALYRQYPQLNLQSYSLPTPVRVETDMLPGASLVPAGSLAIVPASRPSRSLGPVVSGPGGAIPLMPEEVALSLAPAPPGGPIIIEGPPFSRRSRPSRTSRRSRKTSATRSSRRR
jgi:hypothetical protein